jgi:hypothetical protein
MRPAQKGKWMVFFVLNGVEFTTQAIYDEEEAKKICHNVHGRVTEWARGDVWVEESDEKAHLQDRR